MIPPELQKLVDAASIGDTVQAFCECLDRSDVDGIVALFAHQGMMDFGGGVVYRGHSELKDVFTDRLDMYRASSLHCSGTRIKTYDGQTATVTSSLYAFFDAARQDLQMHVWGRYDDELALEAGEWKFVERHLLVAGMNHTRSHPVPERFSPLSRLPIPDL